MLHGWLLLVLQKAGKELGKTSPVSADIIPGGLPGEGGGHQQLNGLRMLRQLSVQGIGTISGFKRKTFGFARKIIENDGQIDMDLL